jgi:replicative DNA helicase
MKLNQRELELKILKCLVTYDDAIFIASERDLKEYHFLTKEPGSNKSLLGKIYNICLDYSSTSGGYKVTETVLEAFLVKKNINDTLLKKFLSIWNEIEEENASLDDFPMLIQLMKDRYCISLMKESMDKNTQFVQCDQVKEMISSMQDYTNLMLEEQEDFLKEKISFDIAESPDIFFSEFNTRLDNPELYKGISCGLEPIDSKTFGFFPSQLIVILAPSSGGKSVQMLNWAHHAHQIQKKNVLYFSFEMNSWLCMLRHVSLSAEIDYGKLKGLNISADEKNKVEEILKSIQTGPYFQYEVSIDDPTPEYIEQKIREVSNSKGKPDLIVADYIGNMTTRTTARHAKNYEKHGDAAEGLFKIAKRYNVPVLTAQQVGKETIKENRKNKDAGKAVAYAQDAAYGDQRLMHLATYVIGLDPNREENVCWYHPVKMRDAMFVPFATRWIPEYNKVVELTESQQSALSVAKSSDAFDKDVYVPKEKHYEVTEFDGSPFPDDFI